MGIDIDRCVSHVNDGLLCCVCRDVLEQPLQAPCEHAFCSSCIHGWLVHEHSCPEDRRTLFASDLRPLSRYMKRDLDELKVKCINYKDGCEFVSSLERIGAHEVACEHKLIKCTNTTCKTVVQRNKLAAHLRACPGSPSLQWTEQKPKITVVETDGMEQLKLKLDECRSMFEKALEEHKREVDFRLDTQRRHFVVKENGMQQQIDSLKTDNLRLREEEARLIEAMNSQKQEIETLQREKNEIFDALRLLQTEVRKLRNNSQPLLVDAELTMSMTKKKCCSGKSRMPSMERARS